MQFRSATPEDLDAIQDLLSSLDLPYHDLSSAHLEHFLVCRDQNDLFGVVGLELYDTAALLRSLAVRPTYRDRGVGTRLTEKIEQYGRRNGVEDVYLLTTTAPDYFERRGYDVVDRSSLPNAIQETEEAARLCPSTATCMRKTLGEPTDASA